MHSLIWVNSISISKFNTLNAIYKYHYELSYDIPSHLYIMDFVDKFIDKS